jgi:BirA family transcriptional regulator, biotin operon repressor / biotin---[acetyl-CoA-carboxylase] ligase
MATLLRSEYQVDAVLKWPNDILVNEKKICGILSQMEVEGDQVAHMSIGLGLNVNNDPDTESLNAVSLKSLLGRSVPRREILVAFLDAFERRIATFDSSLVIEAWKSGNVTLGRRVRVSTVNQEVDGTAVDVDANGGLVVRLADGSCRTVIYGDCFHK